MAIEKILKCKNCGSDIDLVINRCDTVYCSAKCKQRGYRIRKALKKYKAAKKHTRQPLNTPEGVTGDDL